MDQDESGSFESSLASSYSEDNGSFMYLNPPLSIQLQDWEWNYRGEGGANLVISLQVRKKFLLLLY